MGHTGEVANSVPGQFGSWPIRFLPPFSRFATFFSFVSPFSRLPPFSRSRGKRYLAVVWAAPESNYNDSDTAMPGSEWNLPVICKHTGGLTVRSVDDDSIFAAMSCILRNGLQASVFREGDSKNLYMMRGL